MSKRRLKKKLKEFIFIAIIVGVFLEVLVSSFVNFVSNDPLNTSIGFIENNLDAILIAVPAYFVLKFLSNKSKTVEYLRKKEYLKQSITLDQLRTRFKSHPTEFEHYVATVFNLLGYSAKVTPPSADGGKDIVMTKDGKKYIVEVKLYASTNKVGREKIQKLHSALIDSKGDKAIFVTTSDFSRYAVEYAKKHSIQLMNGAEFIELARKVALKENRVDSATLKLEN